MDMEIDLGKKLWDKFRDALEQKLKAEDKNGLETAWDSITERTDFYYKIIPQIADDLKLEYKEELFTVDFALCEKSTSGHFVPRIFIESENEPRKIAYNELYKLCILSSPLKIIISCAQ